MKKLFKGMLVVILLLFVIKVNAATGLQNRSFGDADYSVICNKTGGCTYYVLDTSHGHGSGIHPGETVNYGEKLNISMEMIDDLLRQHQVYLLYKTEGTKEYFVSLDDVKLDGEVKEVSYKTSESTNDILVIGDVKLHSLPSVMSDSKNVIAIGTKFNADKVQTNGEWYYINDGKNVGWFLAVENKDSLLYFYNNDQDDTYFNVYDKIKTVKEINAKINDKNITIPTGTVFDNWFKKHEYVFDSPLYVVYEGYLIEINDYAQLIEAEGTTQKDFDIFDINENKIGVLPKGTKYKSNYYIEKSNFNNCLFEIKYNDLTGWVKFADTIDVHEATEYLEQNVISFSFMSDYDISSVAKENTSTEVPSKDNNQNTIEPKPVTETTFIEKYKGAIAAGVLLFLIIVFVCVFISRKKKESVY